MLGSEVGVGTGAAQAWSPLAVVNTATPSALNAAVQRSRRVELPVTRLSERLPWAVEWSGRVTVCAPDEKSDASLPAGCAVVAALSAPAVIAVPLLKNPRLTPATFWPLSAAIGAGLAGVCVPPPRAPTRPREGAA